MERLCLENALGAAEKGACVLNHTEMMDFITQGGAVTGVRLRDKISNEHYSVKGRMVLNAGGPWAGLVWNKLKIHQNYSIRRTKGVHLLTNKLSHKALVLFSKSDGRLFFVIPWNNYSLVGTTDTDYTGDLERVSANKSDVEYLVKETRNYFPQFKLEDIRYTMAGLRPLVASGKKAESNTTRAHKLLDHESKDGIKGLISVLGGKITAYRAISEEAVDLVCRKLKVQVSCSTSQTLLPGAPAVNQLDILNTAKEKGLPVETIKYLAGIYGSRLYSVLDYIKEDQQLKNPIASGYPDIRAQIKHAVAEEESLTVSDFMLRRSIMGLSPTQGQDAIEAIALQMGRLLGWNNTEVQKQIRDYQASVALSQSFREGGA